MFNKIKRVTSSDEYYPEIDGLRFISILFVIICHLSNHFFEFSGIKNSIIENILENGHNGVRIFFSISGYLLMLNALKDLNINKFYKRRLIRIEPPYLISLFIIYIIIYHRNLNENLNHLISSIFYLHSFIYNSASTISPISWSLEVEIQFYISFPFVFFIIEYFERKYKKGIIIILLLISIGLVINYYYTPTFRTILDNITYFYTGALIAYLSKQKKSIILAIKPIFVSIYLLGISFLLIYINSVNSNIILQCLYLFLIYLLFYFIRVYESGFRNLITSKFIITTGSMCYTIYLYHIIILLLFNKYFFNYMKNEPGKILLYYIIYLIFTWLTSSILYSLFEKPFMKKSIIK